MNTIEFNKMELAKEEQKECLKCYHSILRAIGSMVKSDVPRDDINFSLLMDACYRTHEHYKKQKQFIDSGVYPDLNILQMEIDIFKTLNKACHNITSEMFKKSKLNN